MNVGLGAETEALDALNRAAARLDVERVPGILGACLLIDELCKRLVALEKKVGE